MGGGSGREVKVGKASNDQLPHLRHELVHGNSFACKQRLLLLTLPIMLNDMSNQGQQVSDQTAVQRDRLCLAAGWPRGNPRVLWGSLICAPAVRKPLASSEGAYR